MLVSPKALACGDIDHPLVCGNGATVAPVSNVSIVLSVIMALVFVP
jgi:uncharacterized membrane protein